MSCERTRPDQRLVYNGHKCYHCLKYQSITTSNETIANLFGTLEGRLYGTFILAHSAVILQLAQHSFHSRGNSLCIDGYFGYPLRRYLRTPFPGNLSQQ